MSKMYEDANTAVNRNYKDTVFRMLFREKENPLRNLFYVAAEYQKTVDSRAIYSGKLIKLPSPNFIVFYNGTAKVEEVVHMKLSDAFELATQTPNLELVVTQLNINVGFNTGIKDACCVLNDYIQYVDRVRHYAKEMTLEAAVDRAMNECISEGILTDFLIKNRAEVRMMSIFEYDAEGVRQMWDEEKIEEGMDRYRELVRRLHEDGRMNDLPRVLSDPAFEKEMMEYYKIAE